MSENRSVLQPEDNILNHEVTADASMLLGKMHRHDFDRDNAVKSQAQKRGASSPVASPSSSGVTRRKLELGHGETPRVLSFGDRDEPGVIDLHYQNWKLKKYIERQSSIIKFLELERKFSIEID